MPPVKLIGGISNIPQAFYFFQKNIHMLPFLPHSLAVSGIILAYFPSYPHLARSLGYFLPHILSHTHDSLLYWVSYLLIFLHTHILLAPLGISPSHPVSYPWFSAVLGTMLAYFPSYPHLARSLGYFSLISCLIPMVKRPCLLYFTSYIKSDHHSIFCCCFTLISLDFFLEST